MKKFIAMLLVMACVLSLFGCGSSDTASDDSNGEVVYKDTVTFVTSLDPETFDPRAANRDSKAVFHNMVYDTLFRIDANGNTVPGLAESWEFLDDTTLRVKLKEGVLFHNGMELTTEDVYYCYARGKEDSVSASTMSFLDIENTVIQDKYTIDLKFYEPYAPVFNTLSQATGRAGIGCKAAMEEMGEEEFARNPVGSGPYKLVKWTTDSELVFERHEDYFEGTPPTKNLVVKIMPEAQNRAIALETGEADFAFYIDGADIDRVEELDGYHIEQGPSAVYYTICLSMQEPLFQDKNVRYALSMAINKDAIVKSVFNGAAEVINGMYSPAVFGFKEWPEIEYNVEEAKKLLAEAGYPDGFEIELHVIPDKQFERIAEIIQAMWGEIGVTVNINVSELAAYEAENNGIFQASVRNGSATEPSNILIIYDSSFGSRLNGNDDVLDAMLAEGKTLYDEKERAEKYGEISDYLYDARWTVPFAVTPVIYGISDKVEGYEFNQINFNRYNTIMCRE